MTVVSARPNPYIGPRAFEEGEGELFFGRERELEKLLNLLIARRLVLLYAPSGAGKTSLIQAALIPKLRDEGFIVRRSVRLKAEALPQVPNRYLMATLLSLDEELPASARTSPAELARMSLVSYLERHRADDAVEEVLIFDQFEELLTLDPADRQAKEAFVAELGVAMEHSRRWALFAIREDFYGSLRPLLVPLPTRLDATFRLELLDATRAMQAVQEPVRRTGAFFADAVAQTLVDDLRRTVVQRPDGTSETILGEAVEPVQLQVVCYRLWERKFAQIGASDGITLEDLEQAGDVDTALQAYYGERVAAIAGASGVSERRIREWVDGQLITSTGLRGQVLRDPEVTGGLPNQAVLALVDAHLVRAEERRGAIWYELAHDRLVGPVRADNSAWRAANLTALQRQAALWDEQGRPNGLLLRGDALKQAEAAANEDELSEDEQAFLAVSRVERERSRRMRQLTWLALVVGVIAIALAGVAFWLYGRSEQALASEALSASQAQTAQADAERAASQAQTARAGAEQAASQAQTAQAVTELRLREAQSQTLAFRAIATLDRAPELGLLIAIEAVKLDQNAISDDALRQAVQASPWSQFARSPDSEIADVAISPQGDRLASAGSDGLVRVWDRTTGAELVLLRGHSEGVTSVSYSPAGERIATAGRDGTIRLWDAATGSELRVFSGHSDLISSVAFDTAGARLISASRDGTIRIWDAATGAELLRLVGHGDRAQNPGSGSTYNPWVEEAFFIPGTARVASAGRDGTIRLWDVPGGAEVARFNIEPGFWSIVSALAVNPDGSEIAAASWDGFVEVLDLSGRVRHTLRGHALEVSSVAYSPDGRQLASASRDGAIRIWDALSGNLRTILRGHEGSVSSVTFSSDGSLLVSGSSDGTTRLWPLDGAADLPRFTGHEDGIADAELSHEGQTLVSCGKDGTVRTWDAATGAEKLTLRGHSAWVNAVAFSLDGTRIASASEDRTVRLWDALSRDEQQVLSGHAGGVTDVAFSPDGQRLVSVSGDGTIKIWDAQRGEQLFSLRGSGQFGEVYSIAFRPDGAQFAIGNVHGAIYLWDPQTGTELKTWRAHDGQIEALAYSQDGSKLVSVGKDATIRLWDSTNGSQSIVLLGHAGAVLSAAFSPNSDHVASAGSDGTVRIWEASTGAEISVLRGFDGPVESVGYSPDESRIVSAAGRVIRTDYVGLSDVLTLAQKRVTRALSEEERALFLEGPRTN